MRWSAAGAVLLALSAPASAGAPTSPVGRWLTEGGKAIVEIVPCGSAYCGAIRQVLKPDAGAPGTDINNPDPRLRQRPMGSLRILSGFVAEGQRWRGRIYDPRSGRTYKSFVDIRPDGTLALAGCVWMVCQSQTWRRAR